jgi:alpha-L-arabinofuranosidase
MPAKITLHPDAAKHTISRHIYGHFAEHLGRCIYDGLWVGPKSPIPNTRGWRNDLIDALKKIAIPNLRWPGGCFADTYNWKDGIGATRPSMINVHWGGTVEDNAVGTHEFLDLCDLLGTEPYVCGNVGSGSVREMSEWLEYITMPQQSPMSELRRKNGREDPWALKWWSVGNENWGCGGNMRPQYYADLYRQFASYCRHYNGGKLYKIACGLGDEWNEVVLKECHPHMDGLSVHHYSVIHEAWGKPKGSATDFTTDEYVRTIAAAYKTDTMIRSTRGLLDRYDPAGRIGIIFDEWGTWWDVEPGTNPGWLYQQNTMRDALVAGLSLNIFNGHADRVHMANIAQTVNVLQAMALTEGDKLLLTPTYHVFEMFKPHHDAALVPVSVESPTFESGKTRFESLNASASRAKDGSMFVTVCNLHPSDAAEIELVVPGANVKKRMATILGERSVTAMNTFDRPDTVKPKAFDALSINGDRVSFSLPACSILAITMQ